MQRPTTLILSAGLALLAAVGCSSTSDPATNDVTPAVCEAPGYAVENESVTIERVSAFLRLPSGEPIADLPIQVCGLDLCNNYDSDANGKLVAEPRSSIERPALKYGDGFDFAELAVLLGSEATQDLGDLVAAPLPPFAEGAKFPKTGALTNGDLTLHLASNGSFEIDTLTYGDEAEQVFRSVSIPVADSEQALPKSFGFELAYGVAPLGTTFCPPAGLSLKNSANWPAGSELEVFVQGLNVNEKWAPYGTWLKVADARVSSDGKRIDTTSGGIPILSSIALRRK